MSVPKTPAHILSPLRMSKTRYTALIPPVYLDNLLDKELEISFRGVMMYLPFPQN